MFHTSTMETVGFSETSVYNFLYTRCNVTGLYYLLVSYLLLSNLV